MTVVEVNDFSEYKNDYIPDRPIEVTTNQVGSRLDSGKKPSFKLAVNLEMNIDLAFALGDFILANKCTNPAILAIAHQILGN